MSRRAEPLYGGQHHALRIRLQIGRAYAMAGDTGKAKAPYKDFLTLLKDADATSPSDQREPADCGRMTGKPESVYSPYVRHGGILIIDC